MERESFEDEGVAQLLNEYFVSIKVDREERPDIDSIYMNVCQMMTGHGGWPLSIFMTPEKVPFYAGTYFPKESRYGYPGFKEVILGLSSKYKEDPGHILTVASNVLEALRHGTKEGKTAKVSIEAVEKGFKHFLKSFDSHFGGFGQAPKFPMPHSLMFMMKYYKYNKDERALKMVVKSLEGLANGGIYDHIGFGFSRYSVDEKFLVPHFEKMLYDNALLAITYTEAFQLTKKESFRKIAENIIDYVLRDMQHDMGGFYSAEDADSEGEEGKFYVWEPKEVKAVLGEELGTLYCQIYDISESGNFEGKNIPNLIKEDPGKFESSIIHQMDDARKKLFDYRKGRTPPYKDDKILTSWNSLMIAALAISARVFENKEYLSAAKKAIYFIENNLIVEGRVMVRFREGEVKNKGFIDDYAFLLWAYIEMYETTFDLTYLHKAKSLTNDMVSLFWDQEEGGFFFYGSDNEELLIRQKEAYDGAIPSGNSVAAMQIIRLARLIGDFQLEERVQHIFNGNSDQLNEFPEGHTFLLQSYLLTQMGMKEIVIIRSPGNDQDQKVLNEIQKEYHPEISLLIGENQKKLAEIAPFTNDYKQLNQKSTFYICENFVCQNPTTSVEVAIQNIK